jgi:hypothetical protein
VYRLGTVKLARSIPTLASKFKLLVEWKLVYFYGQVCIKLLCHHQGSHKAVESQPLKTREMPLQPFSPASVGYIRSGETDED